MSRVKVGETKFFFCIVCHTQLEKFVKEGEELDVECPKCGSECHQAEKSKRSYWKPFTPYFHHQTQQNFSSRSEEKAYAKKNGMVDISGDFGKGSMADRKSPKEVSRDRYLAKRGKSI